MAWTVEITPGARKQLRKLGHAPSARIVTGLEEIAALDHPNQRGKAMVGNYSGYWRYRFGDFRVIARIEDDRLVVVVVAVGHRREVYD
ncbi:type II toxin-antitoxin system RelE/ParE family toxin [Aurantiacibacter xanthus]|uniref:Type II toxin-antitoxin system RelE/ParE family toxin n=1 Tax=Aurantiacibacter xanthus TaxID=1784712 RepID=A0A3A1P4E0_9SPHN|nr:type II toxin-antitoxin system RelE/ParE family toxin [Aurantiacibacter xanthus]RIV83462.1 type II toxin-antitoxin system RelE/ParE family toxin [Aurantiacibacter xanthus]